MTRKLKIATIVGTRPEIIRLSRIIAMFDTVFDHVLIHTGQNHDYELNEIFFEELGIRRPDVFLDAVGETAIHTISNILNAVYEQLKRLEVDGIFVLGDTNSGLSVISAKKLKIPCFHYEAGNRCFDQRVPEETNRKIIDHTSDINITYSHIARDHLIRENFPVDQIFHVGSPMKEVLDFYSEGIRRSTVLDRLSLQPGAFFLVSAHREENVDSEQGLSNLFEILDLLVQRYQLPVVLSTHPRTRKRIESIGRSLPAGVQALKPFGFLDYVNLQQNAKVVLSDSGTITEESSILGFPALNIREVQERPEGFEEGAVMMVGLNPERVLQGIELLAHWDKISDAKPAVVRDYDVDHVSHKIAKIVISHVDFVNRRVWKNPAKFHF